MATHLVTLLHLNIALLLFTYHFVLPDLGPISPLLLPKKKKSLAVRKWVTRRLFRENILSPGAESIPCLPHLTLSPQEFSEIRMGLFLPASPGLLDLNIALSGVLPEHTTDLGFPRSALLSSSCQYTMVPLGGLPGHRASGQSYLSGTNGRACANGVYVNRACPVAAVGYAGMKPQQHCPGELQQVTWLWEQRGHTGMGCHRGVVGPPPGTSSLPGSILGC